jgi:hypothetical protein
MPLWVRAPAEDAGIECQSCKQLLGNVSKATSCRQPKPHDHIARQKGLVCKMKHAACILLIVPAGPLQLLPAGAAPEGLLYRSSRACTTSSRAAAQRKNAGYSTPLLA